MSSERIAIRGIPIDFLDVETVVEQVAVAAQTRRFYQLATVNLDFLVQSRRDEEVAAILCQAAVNIPDGAPVVWAARLMGLSGLARLAGADLLPHLAAIAPSRGLRLFFLGGQQNSAARAADLLRDQHLGIEIETFEPPHTSLREMDDQAILTRISAVRPHILFVAFGHPKQEKWIYRNRDSLPMVCMGVGCSFELLAGDRSRAPVMLQAAGLEWVYRLALEPRRLGGRYAKDAVWLLRDLLPWALVQRYTEPS